MAPQVARLGVVQTAAPHPGGSSPLQDALRALADLGRQGTDIACLPEQWLADNTADCQESVLAPFMGIAAEFGMCIVPGAFYRHIAGGGAGDAQGRGRTQVIAAPVISPDGSIIGMQEKIHPFEYENDAVLPGTEARVFEAGGIKFGIMICHDVVYPAVAAALARKGARVILAPSRIVIGGIGPWHTYTGARVLENRIPIVAANVAGGRFGGRSMIAGLRIGSDGIAVIDATLLGGVHATEHAAKSIDLKAYDEARRSRQSGANPFS